MACFRDKYRAESRRLQGWDYAGQGTYFVTICTKEKTPYFGAIENGRVLLNEYGSIAADEWKKTGALRDNIKLDEWVVMPDHFHSIIHLENLGPSYMPATFNPDYYFGIATPQRGVATEPEADPEFTETPESHDNPIWQPNSLGSIICLFKSVVTKHIRERGLSHFAWQPRYYDRIIRDRDALNAMRDYIRFNPQNFRKRTLNDYL